MIAVQLVRLDPTRNVRRFYRLDVQPDLFGGVDLIREWGRLGRSGQVRTQHHETLADARAAFIRQRHAKERRGYQLPPRGSSHVNQSTQSGRESDLSAWLSCQAIPSPGA